MKCSKLSSICVCLLCAVFVAFLSSCKEELPLPSDLKLEESLLMVTHHGGQVSIPYSTINPSSDAVIDMSFLPDWVTGYTFDEESITITVAENISVEKRMADVEVIYSPGELKATLKIIQTPVFEVSVYPDSTSTDYLVWSVIPEDKEMTYFTTCYGVSDYEELGGTDETFIERQLFIFEGYAEFYGLSIEEYLSYVLKSGDSEYVPYGGLKQDYDYYICVYGFNPECELLTDVYKLKVRTLAVQPSDNELTYEITDLDYWSAVLNVTAANDDPYLLLYDYAENWAGMSDQEILDKCTKGEAGSVEVIQFGNFIGDQTLELAGLRPDEDFTVIGFGYDNGVVTTGLFKHDFRTPAEPVGDAVAKLVFDKYYNRADVDGTEGWVYCPMWIETEGDYTSFKYIVTFSGRDLTDTTLVSDEECIEMMGDMTDRPKQLYTLMMDYQFYILSVGVDSEGHHGPVYRQAVKFTEEGCSPIEEWEDMDEWMETL